MFQDFAPHPLANRITEFKFPQKHENNEIKVAWDTSNCFILGAGENLFQASWEKIPSKSILMVIFLFDIYNKKKLKMIDKFSTIFHNLHGRLNNISSAFNVLEEDE